ncbi:MAG: cytochrome family protein [Pseudomonadota bacterium]|nr:cytochrome family protein [Pseudomonadota bacterium]
MPPRLLYIAAGAFLLAGDPHSTCAQGVPGSGEAPATANPAASSAPTPDYHPSMGDLMTMAVQPRHIKLGLAGSRKNWTYAAYELSELRNAFGRIGRTIPKYQTTDTAAVATAMTAAPLDALGQAILAMDSARFATAYAQLTLACNDCHRSLNHGAVVIQIPKEAMYSDQDFRPQGR